MKINTNPKVNEKFEAYPETIKPKMVQLRKIVLDAAKSLDIETIEETLKWGEPSYLVKKGSTVRIDWKAKTPEQYAVYFKCTSKLVTTFKEVYGDLFQYEKTRAIVFNLEDEIPENELSHCISLALTYHKVKHLPLLGA